MKTISGICLGTLACLPVFACFAQDWDELAVSELEESTGAVVSTDAYTELKRVVVMIVADNDQQREALDSEYMGGTDARQAIVTYLKYTLDDAPFYAERGAIDVIRPIVMALNPSGGSSVFLGKFPRVTLRSSFDMTGIVLNGNQKYFESTRFKHILLKRGTNTIETIGGQEGSCEFTIDAEWDARYEHTCP